MILLFGFSNKQNIFCYGTYCEPSWILKSLSVLWQTKNIELDHNDALVEPNVEPRACWFNNQTDCAAPALQRRSTSCIRHHIPSSRPRKYQNPRQFIRSRVCVVTQASCGHARWCGPHLIRPWLALAAGRGPHSFQDVFSPIFPRKFLLRISVVGWGFQGHLLFSNPINERGFLIIQQYRLMMWECTLGEIGETLQQKTSKIRTMMVQTFFCVSAFVWGISAKMRSTFALHSSQGIQILSRTQHSRLAIMWGDLVSKHSKDPGIWKIICNLAIMWGDVASNHREDHGIWKIICNFHPLSRLAITWYGISRDVPWHLLKTLISKQTASSSSSSQATSKDE